MISLNFQNRLALLIAIVFLSGNSNLISNDSGTDASAGVKHQKYIKLQDPLLHTIDGMPSPLGIDADAIKNIIQVLQSAKSMLFGLKPKHSDGSAGEKSGDYRYKDTNCTLMELVEFEKHAKATNNSADLAELNKVFSQAKSDFMNLTKPFIGDISVPAVKDYMTKLINESCRERKRHDSYLLTWSRQDGTDIAVMDRDIKDIQTFALFTSDLCNFLGDLLHSCPRGFKKYKEKYLPKN